MLMVLGISKLGREEIDLGAVGIEELDTIPPPPPPIDDCTEYLKLSDTLELDIDGNGTSEFIFWDLGYCTSLVVHEAGAADIRLGCNIPQQKDLPETVGWVNIWYRITEQEVYERTFDDDEVLGERKVKLDNYGFFIGKDETGFGYVDGQLVYLWQGC